MKQKFHIGLLALAASSGIVTRTQADEAPAQLVRNEDMRVIALLSTQNALLKNLGADIEAPDRERFEHLEKTTQDSLSLIRKNSFVNRDVTVALQKTITEYRSSIDFFRQVQSESSRPRLAKLIQNNESLAEIFGFDQGIRSLVTASVFGQIHNLLMSLQKLPFDSRLKTELSKLNPDIGYVMALAEQGDSPAVIARGQDFIKRSSPTFKEIEKLSSSSAGFDIFLEIQQLLEFFKSFSDYKEAP